PGGKSFVENEPLFWLTTMNVNAGRAVLFFKRTEAPETGWPAAFFTTPSSEPALSSARAGPAQSMIVLAATLNASVRVMSLSAIGFPPLLISRLAARKMTGRNKPQFKDRREAG